MKNLKFMALAGLGLAVVGGAKADIYGDAAGYINIIDAGHTHLDVLSIEAMNTATTLTFSFSLTGSPIDTNWGKYGVLIRRTGMVDTSVRNNGWNRPFNLGGGANVWLAGWADGATPGFEAYNYDGAWNKVNPNGTPAITAGGYAMTVNLADVGIMLGETITFDVYTSGGGSDDTARDSLMGAQPLTWGDQVNTNGVEFTVVPEPATMAVLGLGAAAMLRRRRKS